MNVAQLEARNTQLAELRKAAEARNNTVIDLCTAENRSTTDDEAKTIADARAEVRRIDNEIRANEATIADLRAAEEAEGRASIATQDQEREAAAAAVRAAGGTVQVKREQLTYEKGDQRSSYIADLVAAETGYGSVDRNEARARLDRHAAEMRVELPKIEARMAKATDSVGEGRGAAPVEYERRDLNRTDTTGGYFIPPRWVMDEYIDLARAGRVTANLCRSMALPGGTDSINIPKISTGTATAVQTADNAAVQETDLADTFVQANVKTLAGQQDISLQALEQSPLAFDAIILADLAGDHATKLDQQVISGSNASGQVLGIRSISSVDTTAYTDASPTVAELYPKLADSWQQINITRYLPPEVIIMHPRRWAWIMAAVDSAGRPLGVFQAQGPQNAPYVAGANNAEGFVGTCPFGPIYVDPNIPTTVGGGTEDVIIFGRPSEYYLWEGSVRTRVLTEVLSGNLTVRVQLYSFFAFMPHRRPESTSIVSGTGLAAPTF